MFSRSKSVGCLRCWGQIPRMLAPAVLIHPGAVITSLIGADDAPEQLGLDFDAVKEEWRPVPGYEGRYDVSNLGRMRSWRPMGSAKGCLLEPRLLHPTPWRSGHCYVGLHTAGHVKKLGVHELVLFAFVGFRPPPKHQGAHWDGDPGNNRLDNLRWATPAENEADKARHGRQKTGIHVYNCQLTQSDVDEIRADTSLSQRALAKKYNTQQCTIHRIKTWKSHK